ncbi:monocarboxylate transporter 6-like [Lytechinus variegatus]|uniref:monocarboxylate transporter 6-like n=1 Tax=Lytechinus variegatus TaxID=7654 RepID=UPI001BB2B614|nr:monocarboxylate transporter 6-like [Lytechinus variegatus]
MTSPFVHLLSRRFEPRALAIIGAILSSVCIMMSAAVYSVWIVWLLFIAAGALSSPVYQTTLVLLHQYFNEKYAAANALSSTGALAGGIVLPLVTSYLLIAYDVDGALLCLGAICLHFVVVAALLRPNVGVPMVEEETSKHGECTVSLSLGSPDKNIPIQGAAAYLGCKIKRFVRWLGEVTDLRTLQAEKTYCLLILPSLFLHQITFVGWAMFMVPCVTSYGIAPTRAAYFPLTGSCGGLVGRIVYGAILYLRPKWGKRSVVTALSISSLSLFSFAFLQSRSFQFVSTFFAGFGLYATFSSFSAVLNNSVAKENFSGILSVMSFVRGIGVATGSYVTGLIFEITGSFAVAFKVLAFLETATIILITIFAILQKRKHASSRT